VQWGVLLTIVTPNKLKKIITPSVNEGCCGECHKVYVSLYSVCHNLHVHVLLTLLMHIISNKKRERLFFILNWNIVQCGVLLTVVILKKSLFTMSMKKIENNYYPLSLCGLLWRVPQGTCIIIYFVPGCTRSVARSVAIMRCI